MLYNFVYRLSLSFNITIAKVRNASIMDDLFKKLLISVFNQFLSPTQTSLQERLLIMQHLKPDFFLFKIYHYCPAVSKIHNFLAIRITKLVAVHFIRLISRASSLLLH